jgi:hypothetical protein
MQHRTFIGTLNEAGVYCTVAVNQKIYILYLNKEIGEYDDR